MKEHQLLNAAAIVMQKMDDLDLGMEEKMVVLQASYKILEALQYQDTQRKILAANMQGLMAKNSDQRH